MGTQNRMQADMASKYDGASLEVMNWAKYNPRKTTQRPNWFRFENDIATGPGFFGLDCEVKWLWVFILSLVSQKNGKSITWNSDYCHGITGIKPKKQDEAIDIFIKFVRLHLTRAETIQPTYSTDGRDETDDDGRDETDTRANSFTPDLEAAYLRYPRKDGKSKGIKKLKSENLSEQEYAYLIKAIENYGRSRRDQDTVFTKHFSTFVSEWRDWIDYEPPLITNIPKGQNYAEKRMAANLGAHERYLESIGADDEQAS